MPIRHNPMRNSILPLAVVIAICLGFVLSTRGGAQRGEGGPTIDPGIYREVTNGIYKVTSMRLTVEDAFTGGDDHPFGLKADRRIVVSGEDRAPLTAALMRSLAEQITAAGGTAILDPLAIGAQDMLPPVDAAWCVRIGTATGIIPPGPGGALDATMRIHVWTMRLPDGHPAGVRQQDGAARDAVLVLHHASRGAGPGGWPEWFAAVGRDMAHALLAKLEPGPPAAPAAPMADWGTTLPMPPRLDLLRWNGAFQQDFVRGWVGRIDGLTTTVEGGKQEATLDKFTTLLGHGGWQHDTAMKAPGFAVWYKVEGEGRLTIHGDAGGYDVVAWWERDQPAELFKAWMDALGSGIEPAVERAARSQDLPPPGAPPLSADQVRARCRDALGRYRDCAIIPEDMRAAADGLLAAKLAPAALPSAPNAAPNAAPK